MVVAPSRDAGAGPFGPGPPGSQVHRSSDRDHGPFMAGNDGDPALFKMCCQQVLQDLHSH